MARAVFDVEGLQALLDVLSDAGYDVFGPTLRDGAIVPGPVTATEDFPRGVGDEQAPAHYRLHERRDAAFFGFAAPAVSWKPLLFPSRRALWRFDRDGTPATTEPDPARRAFVGVRSCDLHGILVQDRVLATRGFTDADYAVRRSNTFIVAVACGSPAQTCFCASMGTGPAPDAGFDLALTEVVDADGHRFLAEIGTDAGAAMLERVPTRPVAAADDDAAGRVVDGAVARMQRAVDTTDIRDLLYDNLDHPRWDDVARRCLACTNCTLVCPTCFCVTTEDVTGLTEPVGRDRVWDSCFNAEHSHLHGGAVRDSTRSRYRQWATHKFASWIDQFGTSGCVGCGRCIAWCPAGIDVTEELAAIRATTVDRESGA